MDRPEDRIQELCASLGIEPTYYDIWGDERNVPIETLRVILNLISGEIERVEAQGCRIGSTLLPDLTVNSLLLKEGDKLFFQILSGHPLEGEVEWLLETESGNYMEGSLRASELNQKEASYPWKHYLTNVSISRDLEYGYHFIHLKYKGKHIRKLLINAPTTCYVPEWLLSERKVYGINLQLYSLRSQTNLGIGEFGDLRSLGEGLKGSCLTILGMSPLNALFPHDPKMISPYSPCSRLFLNPLYLGIGDLLQLGKEAEAQVRHMMGPLKGDGDDHPELVRYEEIWAFKKGLFEALYEDFKASHLHNGTPLSQEFLVYQKERGELLRYFSTFLALNEMFLKEKGYYSWHQWPMAFRDPFSDDVKGWAEKNPDRLQYYQFLFWMTERAFRETKGQLNRLGKLLYLDFPVGVNGSGFEPWYYKDLFVCGISIGAPPDEFNPKGQDWGFPPLNPMALRASDFKP
ncbi:MAG: 4-alpha-glucanotransferase, partial [Desulfatiglandales bacterium]